jgi:hypothetical protein
MLIIQASHVGYDRENKVFGTYRRAPTTHLECSASCGKIQQVISWYQNEYDFSRHNILLHNEDGQIIIIVDNQLLHQNRDNGLLLYLDKLIATDAGVKPIPLKILSTAKVYPPTQEFIDRMGETAFNGITPLPIGAHLTADMFYFRRDIPQTEEAAHHLEHNLIHYMPQIVTASSPQLLTAQITTQIEFDRTFRTIVKEHAYKGKKVLFIAGVNIDISPQSDQLFPLTKFIPWAAYIQDGDGYYFTLEQEELVQTLQQQSIDNPDQIDLENAILMMASAEEIKIEL